ncbi:uncharacterized protein LOC127136225 [Lathyrus oleraceus]|uniref:uncharacterized protein LOC127136225 n=1 Tax=Pisum sativum TaxID=3888 RepID=UPI0021D029A4|nr:uncharacterized protein LOC127136225 [Pisum sativum]
MTNANGFVVPKPEAKWNEEDEKKYNYDWKARNVLIAALCVDEYYRVSHCTSVKAIWDSLQITHEGTNDIKLARSNTLTQEYDLFHMEDGETIVDMQKRFSHLINSTLHNEAKEAFKHLALNKKIFSHLEKKISDSEKELETLKKSMIEATKGKTEDDKGFWFRWILIRPVLNKTPYELLKGRKPNVSHLHIFGCKCFILNNGKENLGSIIDGAGVPSEDIIKDQDEKRVEHHPEKAEEEPDHISKKKEEDHSIDNNDLPLEWKSSKDHPIDNILGDILKGVTTRSKITMQEKLNQFKRNEMWDFVPPPRDHRVIGTKWVFRNKLSENGVITRNKACLVARGYQSCPKESYLKAVKRILRYLCGTSKYGIWFFKGSDCSLVGYSDSDFAGCKSDWKNTSGTCFFIQIPW